MKNKKDYTIELLIGLFLFACLFSCTPNYKIVVGGNIKRNKEKMIRIKYEEYFKAGQVLNPDRAISDTLVVDDAYGLNCEVALYEQGFKEYQGDKDICRVFYKYCSVK